MTSSYFTYSRPKVLKALRFHFFNRNEIKIMIAVVNIFAISSAVLYYVGKISPLAFSSMAQIDSYACRTGMGNRTEFFPQTDKSLAQLLADHLQIKVRAFVRRSDYKNTWGSFEERQLGKLCGISNKAVPGEEWCKKWNALADERYENKKAFKFAYQIMGAINPVISGSSPFGAPGGYFEFLPK